MSGPRVPGFRPLSERPRAPLSVAFGAVGGGAALKARRVGATSLLLSVLVGASMEAHAQTVPATSPPPITVPAQEEKTPADMGVSIVPMLSLNSTTLPWGWTGVVVTISNSSASPARGEVRAAIRQFGDKRNFEVSAPYAVPAGGAVAVKLPVEVNAYGQIEVRAVDVTRGPIAAVTLQATEPQHVVLLDASGSQLKGGINDASVTTMYEEPSRGSRGGGSATVGVVIPRTDPATGDPVLPDRAALYDVADAVLMRSDMLVKLAGAELEALAGFVLAGGTLAVAVTRPEDVRHPTLAAFAGGEIAQTAVSSEALRTAVPPLAEIRPSSGLAPGEEVGNALGGFRGGNLRGSAYGNSAPYGLGEVHLLAFDPTRKPALEDAWVQARMVDAARRAYDRRAHIVFRPGAAGDQHSLTNVRKQLDPNEGSRWAIAAAAVLLLIYAVIAGPLNYSIAARKNKPLSALRILPILAAITFFLIVGIGMAAKGASGRARHLSLVEAGAGMSKASIRRYRGFFASSAKELTVRTTDATSVVRTAIVSEPGEVEDRLVVDREGARLENVSALPWQTLVMREDGIVSLGEGIAIAKKDAAEAIVKNRSGRDLRAALLRLPSGEVRYFPKIADGDVVESSAGREVGALPKERSWVAQVGTTRTMGSMQIRGLGAYHIGAIVDEDAPGLGDAWLALENAAQNDTSWFLDDVPVLVAQMDGGEGRTSDSGLRLESDRLLVRVVGYGGAP